MTWLTLIAGLFSISFGVIRVRKGAKILATRAYSYREKTLLSKRKMISRDGEATRAFGITTLLSGIGAICLLAVLIANRVFDPLSLVVFPVLIAVLIEMPGFLISERNSAKSKRF